jgi:hypothetical protein
MLVRTGVASVPVVNTVVDSTANFDPVAADWARISALDAVAELSTKYTPTRGNWPSSSSLPFSLPARFVVRPLVSLGLAWWHMDSTLESEGLTGHWSSPASRLEDLSADHHFLLVAKNSGKIMLFELLFVAFVGFGFVAIAAYAGALRALEVYFDPNQDSIFLSDGAGPRNNQ